MQVGFCRGYKPFILEKSDLKHIGKFSEVESKDNKILDDIFAMNTEKGFDGIIFVLQKNKKYKAVYIFRPEKAPKKSTVLRLYKSVTMDDVEREVVCEFEKEIINQLKEFIYTDDLWEKVIWNGKVIKPEVLRLGSICLPVSILGILVGLGLSILTENYIWLVLWICIGIIGGSVVSKIIDNKK